MKGKQMGGAKARCPPLTHAILTTHSDREGPGPEETRSLIGRAHFSGIKPKKSAVGLLGAEFARPFTFLEMFVPITL